MQVQRLSSSASWDGRAHKSDSQSGSLLKGMLDLCKQYIYMYIQTSKVSLGMTYRNYTADTVSYHLLKAGHSSYLAEKCSSDFLIGILLPAELCCKESSSEAFVFGNSSIWELNLF